MACKLIRKDLESVLYDKLVQFYGDEIAIEKAVQFESSEFIESFGDYMSLMEEKPELIPVEFNNRLNEKFEPLLIEDSIGLYYLDKDYSKQYVDTSTSKLYNILESERAVNSLVEILANDYLDKGGFNLNFDTLNMSDNKSKTSLLNSIKDKLESLAMELIENENDVISTNGGVLFNILDDQKALDEMVSKIKDFYKSRHLVYDESLKNEDIDVESQQQREPVFNQASFKVNPKNKITAAVKIRLSMIKNPSDLDPDFGQPRSVDYDSLYNKITAILKNNPVTIKTTKALGPNQKDEVNVENIFKTIIDKLLSHSNNIKYLGNVAKYLKDINDIKIDLNTVEGVNVYNFIAGFVSVMNLQKNILEYSEVLYKDVEITPAIKEEYIIPANGAKATRIIKEAVMGREIIYNRRDAAKDTKVEQTILTNWGLQIIESLSSISKEGNKSFNSELHSKVINTLKTITSSNSTNEVKANKIVSDLLPMLGINLNEASFKLAINDLKEYKLEDAVIDQNYLNFITNTTTTINNALLNISNNNEIVNTYWYRQIAKAEAFYREDGSESSVFTAGEIRYLYSNPSYLHNTVNTWKKDRELLLDEYNNQSSYEKGSFLYEHLLALDIKNNKDNQLKVSKERIEAFQVTHFSSFRDFANDKSKQKTNKDISKNEYIQDTVNGLLSSKIDPKNPITHTRTTTAPGKATQYNLQHDMFIKSGFEILGGVKDVSSTAEMLYDKYLMAEFNRMNEQAVRVANNDGLKVYYHTDRNFKTHNSDGKLTGSAFKSQLFPSLSFDNIDNIFKPDNTRPSLYNKDGSIIMDSLPYYKSDIISFIEDKVLEHAETLKKDLIKYNIIERSGDNSYINKGIDSRIIKSYTKGTFEINEDTLFSMVGDIWLNGLVNHVEYSKLFAGDIAYYKDSVDYIKRIGATYTDGTYEFLSDINKDFKVGVTEAVNYVEPYLEELKEVIKSDTNLVEEWESLINAADAQAWITPRRWKSIMLGVGKYTSKHNDVYQKLIGKDKTPFTTEDLKLVAQPLKGVYFSKDELGSPIFLKYSQAVMLPQMLNKSKLKDIHDFMEHHKLDELVTFDAIKTGSLIPTKIHNELGNVDVRDENGKFKDLNVMTINSKGWKLQQDLPVKTFKETDIGSQILKNMLILISDKLSSKEKMFSHNGKEFTPEEFAKELDSTLGTLVLEGYNDLMKEFDISKDGKIGNIDKFYDTLADEIIERGGSNEVVKALQAKLSIYALPGLKNKLDNIFASIINDRTVKIKTNGGSFIQMSAFGLSKEEADSKYGDMVWSPALKPGDTVKPYTYKKNGKGEYVTNIFGEKIISPEQILISGSFIAKYIPDYHTYSSEQLFGKVNEETGELEGGMIDNKILSNIIGYRIPNQGPSSNGALEVVGILPEGMGDTIVAFTGITKKTGSDFDIDKMYVMFPNYRTITNAKSETYKYLRDTFKGSNIKETINNLKTHFETMTDSEFNEEQIAEMLSSNDTRVEFMKDLTDTMVDLILKNKSNPMVAEIIKKLDIKPVGLKYISSETNSKFGKQNKVIELYKELILHQSNITKIMTPLDHPHIQMDAQNLSPAAIKSDLDNYEFIQDIITKYSFLAGLAGVGQEANTSSDYAMGTMSDVYFEDVNLGNRSHQGDSYPVTRTVKSDIKYVKNIPHTKFDKITSVEISQKELEEWVKSYNDHVTDPKKKLDPKLLDKYKSFPISDSISALMNAFVDIAKDPYITNVNWNMMTTNTGNMMIRAGVHPFVVMSFLAQPIIGEYIDFISQYETQDKTKQSSNSKDAFRIFKVGELIKDDIITISKFSDGTIATINARKLYEIGTKYEFKLDSITSKIFTNPRKLELFAAEIGLPKGHKFTPAEIASIDVQVTSILDKHRKYFTETYDDFVINDSLGTIRKNVFNSTDSYQSRVFQTFLKYQGFAKKVKASMDASKHGVEGMGKNTTQLLIAINKIQNVDSKGVINYNTKMYYPDGSPKFLAYLETYNLQGTKSIVQNNPLLFVSSTPFVWNSYNEISRNIYGINLEDDSEGGLGDKLDKVFNTYLMSGFAPFDMNSKEKTDLISKFPDKFIEYKNKYSKRYKILDELNINKTESRKYVVSTNKSNSKEYTDSMINSWRELIKVHPEFGDNLVKYAFITSGFNNNTNSFFQFIPPSYFFQNNFNGYVKQFTKYPGLVDQNFINHFYLSNLKDSQIVKYVNKTQILKDQPFANNKLVSMNYEVDKEFINIDDVYYKRVGIRNYNGKNYNLYTNYIRVENGYTTIRPLVSDKDGGITVSNFNSNRISLPADSKLTKEQIEALDDAIMTSDSTVVNTTQQDSFGQEDIIEKEDLSNVDEKGQISMSGDEVKTTNNSNDVLNETKPIVRKNSEILKPLFIKDTDNSNIAKGSVVSYKDKQWIVWNITDKDGAQLIDTEGNKFSGTPKLDKLSKIGDYTTTEFNGTDYIVTANENIYSLDTGKQVYTSLDNSTKVQKSRIINNIMQENGLESIETIYEQYKDSLKESLEELKMIEQIKGTDKTIEYIKKCK